MMMVGHATLSASPPPVADVRRERTGGLDLNSHEGLRGVLALWVAAFHCFLASDVAGAGITLEASGIMPAFFSLSGFTLAIVYGTKTHAKRTTAKGHSGDDVEMACSPGTDAMPSSSARPNSDAMPSSSEHPASDEPRRASWHFRFYVNRFARLLPTYWLSLALAIPPTIAGFSIAGGMGLNPNDTRAIIVSTLTSFFGVATVAGTIPTPPINPPGWFVCTLLFCYLAFPFVLPMIERFTDRQLAAGVAWAYWACWLIWAIVVAVSIGALGYDWATYDVFTLATFTPWSRFPEFIAGAFAGVLALRHPKIATHHHVASDDAVYSNAAGHHSSEDPKSNDEEMRGEMPWPEAVFARQLPLPWLINRVGSWEWRTSVSADTGALLFAVVIVTENMLNYLPSERMSAYPHYWLQQVVAFSQLELIVGGGYLLYNPSRLLRYIDTVRTVS